MNTDAEKQHYHLSESINHFLAFIDCKIKSKYLIPEESDYTLLSLLGIYKAMYQREFLNV